MSKIGHLTVLVIGIGATVLCAMGKLTGDQVMYIYLFIGGYTLKNGNSIAEVFKTKKDCLPPPSAYTEEEP